MRYGELDLGEADLKASPFPCYMCVFLTWSSPSYLFAVFREVCKSRKRKDKVACEWKGKENPCCFKVCGLFKDLGDL